MPPDQGRLAGRREPDGAGLARRPPCGAGVRAAARDGAAPGAAKLAAAPGAVVWAGRRAPGPAAPASVWLGARVRGPAAVLQELWQALNRAAWPSVARHPAQAPWPRQGAPSVRTGSAEAGWARRARRPVAELRAREAQPRQSRRAPPQHRAQPQPRQAAAGLVPRPPHPASPAWRRRRARPLRSRVVALPAAAGRAPAVAEPGWQGPWRPALQHGWPPQPRTRRDRCAAAAHPAQWKRWRTRLPWRGRLFGEQ